MNHIDTMKLALEALESCGAGHISDGGNQWYDEKQVDKAITALREALAEQPAQQEPEIVQRVKRYAGKTLRTARNPNITARECIELANWIAAAPQPAQRKPLTDEWLPVTQNLLNEQHPWLYQPMWIAMKGGVVVQGYYEWRQGRNPDRFITDLGDEWAFNADFVMPITKPTPPAIEATIGIKENT